MADIFMPEIIGETEHLLIRELTLFDLPDYMKLIGECDAGIDTELKGLSRDELKAHLEGYIRYQYGFYGYGNWAILIKEDGISPSFSPPKFIGVAGVANGDESDVGLMGWALLKAYRGKGYALEACSFIADYALSELIGFKSLTAYIAPENAASERLARKIGMTRTAKIRNGEYLWQLQK